MNRVTTSELKNIADRMVSITAGRIALRDDRIKHEWEVHLPSFLIDVYPVTQDLYYLIMQKSPSTFKGDQLPVESVTWKMAVEFCNLLSEAAGYAHCYSIHDAEVVFNKNAKGYRLPSEAEWQYTCQAGTTAIRYGQLDDIAWCRENAQKETHDVGTKAPNAWGIYDMLGNVWEWCSDIYDHDVYGSYRIIRGGGWYDDARGCMATNRRRSHPTSFLIDDLGFRIARSL